MLESHKGPVATTSDRVDVKCQPGPSRYPLGEVSLKDFHTVRNLEEMHSPWGMRTGRPMWEKQGKREAKDTREMKPT